MPVLDMTLPSEPWHSQWHPMPKPSIDKNALIWALFRWSAELDGGFGGGTATFYQSDFVAFVVVADFVHEGADEKHSAAADVFDVVWIGRIGEFGWVEAGAFVADRD